MAWPTTPWMAALLLLPAGASIGWGLHRLRAADGAWPAKRVIAVAALSWLPAAAAALVLVQAVLAWLGPLGVPATLLWIALAHAILAGLVHGATRPDAEPYLPAALGIAGLLVLVGFAVATEAIPRALSSEVGLAPVAPGALVLSATAAPAAHVFFKRGDRARWLGPVALAVLLVPWSAVGAGFTAIELTAGNQGGPAVYRWGVHAEPNGTGAYRVEVPFPVADGDAAARQALAHLREGLHVAEGRANLTLDGTGATLAIEAAGPVTVRASWAFFGSIGDREAFGDYHLAEANATRAPGGPANVTVSWTVGFSGGQGHTCWARGALRVDLAPGQSKALAGDNASEGGDPLEPWATACA